jgi:hypothetical protein
MCSNKVLIAVHATSEIKDIVPFSGARRNENLV